MTAVAEYVELAPGVHRIEFVRDDKLHGFHVLDGDSGPILVDPGYERTPTEVYEPFLADRGQSLADAAVAIVTHADVDHHGGIADLRDHSPGVTVMAHVADVPLVESIDRIMDERYCRFERDGIEYEADRKEWLRDAVGPDPSVDVALRGGERITVAGRRLAILHAPGHTHGHLMLYDEASGLLLGADGFFGRGLRDVTDTYLQPPPYLRVDAYENTIRFADSLGPETLSFTHYDVQTGDEIRAFVAESLDFVAEFEQLALALADDGPVTLRSAIDETVERKGSFGLDEDLAFPLAAHFTDLVDRGALVETTVDGRRAWKRAEDG